MRKENGYKVEPTKIIDITDKTFELELDLPGIDIVIDGIRYISGPINLKLEVNSDGSQGIRKEDGRGVDV